MLLSIAISIQRIVRASIQLIGNLIRVFLPRRIKDNRSIGFILCFKIINFITIHLIAPTNLSIASTGEIAITSESQRCPIFLNLVRDRTIGIIISQISYFICFLNALSIKSLIARSSINNLRCLLSKIGIVEPAFKIISFSSNRISKLNSIRFYRVRFWVFRIIRSTI